MRLTLACASLACTLLASCSLPIPKTNEPIVPTLYDLGPAPAHKAANPAVRATLLIPAVTSPEWVDDGIAYRLLYEDPARLQTYTRSRWSADPPALVTERMRSRFAPIARGVLSPLDSARSDYTLRVELRDFSQSLESPTQSYVIVRARASLIASLDRTLVAQRDFEVRRPAPANAEGAVKALSAATDAFLDELVSWTTQNVK